VFTPYIHTYICTYIHTYRIDVSQIVISSTVIPRSRASPQSVASRRVAVKKEKFDYAKGCQIFISATYQNRGKYTKRSQNLPKDHKLNQNDIKIYKMHFNFTKIFHPKSFRNISKSLFFNENSYAIWQP
jgi:hypothetical protein